jgi:hypothetical protein
MEKFVLRFEEREREREREANMDGLERESEREVSE